MLVLNRWTDEDLLDEFLFSQYVFVVHTVTYKSFVPCIIQFGWTFFKAYFETAFQILDNNICFNFQEVEACYVMLACLLLL